MSQTKLNVWAHLISFEDSNDIWLQVVLISYDLVSPKSDFLVLQQVYYFGYHGNA